MVKAGKFKDDLLDRLSFEVLYLPPLRARQEDIIYLARYFAAQMGHELGLEESPRFSSEAERKLGAYRWPGNIRELKNVVERSVYRSGESVIREIEFDPFSNPYGSAEVEEIEGEQQVSDESPRSQSLVEEVRSLEIRRLGEALSESRNRQADAANLLGLSYHQFRNLYRKYKDDLS